MRTPRFLLLTLLVAAATLAPVPALAQFHGCKTLNYIAHGIFHDVGGCMQFTPDPTLEIPDPAPFGVVNRGSWRDGMTGTVYAMSLSEGACAADQSLQVCDWDADYSRNIIGTLVFLNFIECPGYYIRQSGPTANADYYIRNTEDFPELFVPENLGKKVRGEVVVDTGVTICIAKIVSHLVDYDVLPNQ
jgi:hypothetical protein